MKWRIGMCLTLCLLVTGCAGGEGSVAVVGQKASPNETKGFEILMWRTGVDARAASQPGNGVLQRAIAKFKLDDQVDIHLIEIEANTREEFLQKRNALLASGNPPEILLFNTLNPDELSQVEEVQEQLVPIKDILTDLDDIYPGLQGDYYSSFACMALSGTLNEDLGKGYLPQAMADGEGPWVSSEAFTQAMMSWGKEALDKQKINLTYAEVEVLARAFSQECFDFHKAHGAYKLSLKPEVILDKIMVLSDLYAYTAEGKNKDYKGLAQVYSGEDQEAIMESYKTYFANIEARLYQPFMFSTANLLNLEEVQRSKVPNWEPLVVGQCPFMGAVGFALVDTGGGEALLAQQFAQYLISPQFQAQLDKSETKRPSCTGSVRRSVNQDQIRAAQEGVVSQYVTKIDGSAIALKSRILDLWEDDLFLEHYSEGTLIQDLSKKIQGWAIDYHRGLHRDEAYFIEEIQKFEDRMNLVLKE